MKIQKKGLKIMMVKNYQMQVGAIQVKTRILRSVDCPT